MKEFASLVQLTLFCKQAFSWPLSKMKKKTLCTIPFPQIVSHFSDSWETAAVNLKREIWRKKPRNIIPFAHNLWDFSRRQGPIAPCGTFIRAPCHISRPQPWPKGQRNSFSLHIQSFSIYEMRNLRWECDFQWDLMGWEIVYHEEFRRKLWKIREPKCCGADLALIWRQSIMTMNYSISIFSLEWAHYLRIHATGAIILHSTTLYLCVTMAFIRWRAMRDPQSRWLRPQITGWAERFWRDFTESVILREIWGDSVTRKNLHCKITGLERLLRRFLGLRLLH